MKAFVAMPFNPVFLPVWKVIKAACQANNIEARRVDQLPQIDNIYQTILGEIEAADLVIVDFTGDKHLDAPNANVVTEAKHAKDHQKPMVILTQSASGLPFDWKQYRAVVYQKDPTGLEYLKEVLTENLEGIVSRLSGSTKLTKVRSSQEYQQQALQWIETSSDGQFNRESNGIIWDTTTNLEWYVGPDQDTEWDVARAWADSLIVDGGDWRMPSVEELKGLYQSGKGSRNMDPVFQTNGWAIWSGVLTKHGSSARLFDFRYGREDLIDRYCSYNGRGFAVRTGRH